MTFQIGQYGLMPGPADSMLAREFIVRSVEPLTVEALDNGELSIWTASELQRVNQDLSEKWENFEIELTETEETEETEEIERGFEFASQQKIECN